MTTAPRLIFGAGQERLTEKQFSRQIRDMASALGWTRIYHTQYSLGSDPGYPDLTITGKRGLGVVFIEVKGGAGRSKVSLEQEQYCRDIQAGGVHAYIAFPKDVRAVEALLRGELPLPESPTPYIADHWGDLHGNQAWTVGCTRG